MMINISAGTRAREREREKHVHRKLTFTTTDNMFKKPWDEDLFVISSEVYVKLVHCEKLRKNKETDQS